MLARCALGLVLILICDSVARSEVRTWTDRQGKTMRAEFVRVHEGRVVLKSGTQTSLVPLSQLSQQDQDYVEKQLNRKASRSKEEGEGAEGNQPVRVWTDVRGNQVAAFYVRMNETQAVLSENNRPRLIGFAELSEKDQEYIKELLRGQGQEQQATALEQHVQQAKAAAAAAANQAGASPSALAAAASPLGSFQEQMRQQAEDRRQRDEQQQQERMQRAAEEQERRRLEQEQRRQEQEARDSQRQSVMQQMQERTAMPQPGFPAYTPPPAPEITTVTEYRCSKCNKVVPDNIQAGGTCPHCGVYFDYTESPSGQRQYASSSGNSSYRVSGRGIKGIVFLVILVSSAVAGLWKKFSGGSA